MNKHLQKFPSQRFHWNLSVADTVAVAVTVLLSCSLCVMYVKLLELGP